MHVLLVDDDRDDRFLFKDALAKTGLPIFFQDAEDCYQALDILQQMKEETPDIVFIDINMPDIDGFECLKRIKAKEAWKDIPIIIYSTSNNQLHIDEAGRLGAAAYIRKPNDFWELCAKLKQILSSNFNDLTNQIYI